MVTLEELEAKIDKVAASQQEVLKGLVGFQTAFKGLSQVFGMLGPALAPLANKDFEKEFKDAEEASIFYACIS